MLYFRNIAIALKIVGRLEHTYETFPSSSALLMILLTRLTIAASAGSDIVGKRDLQLL